MKYYIQFGAASGDDVFYHEFLKGVNPLEAKIILVEPIAHEATEAFYKDKGFDYQVIKKCIVKNNHTESSAVMHLYGSSDLATLMDRKDMNQTSEEVVECVTIGSFLSSVQGGDIDTLFMDIEGLDREIILDIDFEKHNIKNIYFEAANLAWLDKTQRYLMGALAGKVHEKLSSNSYQPVTDKVVAPENEWWIKK